MLAQNELVLAPDHGGVHALVVRQIFHQSIDMDASLVAEHPLADQALAPAHRFAGGRLDAGGQFREFAQIDTGFNAVQLAQTHHDFFQGGIAGPLAQAVDRGVQMRRTGDGSRQCVGSRQPQVVVGMHLDVQISRSA